MGDSQRGTRETAQRFSRPVAPRPLSHGCRRASVSAAASVGRWATSHRDVAAPKGEPSLASPLGGGAPLWGAERVRRPPPPKALLQSIEISAILKVHGLPCGSLPRNGTSRLLAQSTGRTACNRSDCIFAKAKNRCSLAAGPSQEVWTSCLHSPLWGAL